MTRFADYQKNNKRRKKNKRLVQKRKLSYFGKMMLIIACFLLMVIVVLELLLFLPDIKIRNAQDNNSEKSVNTDSDIYNEKENAESVVLDYKCAFLDVTPLCQNPELPTGCESCCATMALQYIGIETDKLTVASLLPAQKLSSREGRLWGTDPEKCFIGSPFETFHSFGCFENVIINMVNRNFEGVCARKVYGSLEDFCTEFIDRNQPVMIWATMNMKAITYVSHWTLPDGCEYYWPSGEHCLLLVGYDEFYYYLNDPLEGAIVAYKKEIVEAVYEEMGSRAVVIYRS